MTETRAEWTSPQPWLCDPPRTNIRFVQPEAMIGRLKSSLRVDKRRYLCIFLRAKARVRQTPLPALCPLSEIAEKLYVGGSRIKISFPFPSAVCPLPSCHTLIGSAIGESSFIMRAELSWAENIYIEDHYYFHCADIRHEYVCADKRFRIYSTSSDFFFLPSPSQRS